MARLIICLAMFVTLLILWFLGGHLVKGWPDTIARVFGKADQLENTFAPISALFAALASAGALFAIYTQGRQFQIQQFQSNFYTLLEIYKKSKYDILANNHSNEKRFSDCFEFYIKSLRMIYLSINKTIPDGITIDEENTLKLAHEVIDPWRDESGKIDRSPQEIFGIAYDAFKYAVQPDIQHYIRKLYQLIKYTHSDAPRHKRSVYMAIIRAEFSKYEHAMLYYDVLVYKDDSSFFKKTRFKSLIEKNKLLHTMDRQVLFDNGAAGSYRACAYRSRAERVYKFYKGLVCSAIGLPPKFKALCARFLDALYRNWPPR